MEVDLIKLMQPQRIAGESVEDYRIRRATARKYNKLESKGQMFHVSKWYSIEQNKEGKDVVKEHHNTYVKKQVEENA